MPLIQWIMQNFGYSKEVSSSLSSVGTVDWTASITLNAEFYGIRTDFVIDGSSTYSAAATLIGTAGITANIVSTWSAVAAANGIAEFEIIVERRDDFAPVILTNARDTEEQVAGILGTSRAIDELTANVISTTRTSPNLIPAILNQDQD